MNETLKLFLDLVVRNPNGGKQVADDIRRLRVEAAGSARPFNAYEHDLERIGKRAGLTAQDVAKLRREIEATNRVVLTDRRGAITGVGSGSTTQSSGGGGFPTGLLGGVAGRLVAGPALLGLGAGGIAAGAAGFAGRAAFEQAGKINEARAEIEGLHRSLELIGISSVAATRPLEALGLTAEQSSRAVLSLTNAGARQDEILGAVSFSYDLARRRSIGFNEAVALVSSTIRSGNERVAEEIGLKTKLADTNLSAEERTRGLAAAISAQGTAYDAFKEKAAGVSGLILEIDQAQRNLGQTFDQTFADTAESIGRAELALKTWANELFKLATDPRIQALSAFTGGPFGLLPTREAADVAASRYPLKPTGAFVGPPNFVGPEAPSEGALADRRRAAERAEIRQRSLAGVRAVEDRLTLEGLTGLDKLREENRQAREGLLKLPGVGQSDLSKVDAGFAARITREQDEQRRQINELIRDSDNKALQFSVEQARKLAADTSKIDLTDIAKFNADQRKIEEADRKEAEAVQIRASAEERIIQLRSRDGSELREILALRLRTVQEIARLEGDTSRVALESLKARKDIEVQLAQLERDRIDRGRGAAESAFDALVSGGGGGVNAFLKSQITGVGRTVTGNLAETLLKNSGTLGLDGLIGGQQKNGKLTPIGQALQGTFLGLNPADIQRRNIEALDLNTTEIRQLTAAISGRAGGDGAALTPFRSEGGGSLGIDWLRENTQTSATAAESTNEATKETNQLLAKIVQTSIFSGAAVTGIVGGTRRGGVGGALQTAGGVASAAAGIFKALDIAGSVVPGLSAIGIGASLVGSFFGGPDPLKREKQIQDELNRNRFQAPESVSRSFDTFGRSVEVSGGSVRVTNVTMNISAADSKSFMDRRTDIVAAMRQGIHEDGGASLNDIRTYFEG